MHTLVFMNSKYGNTRRIAEAIAGILNTTGLARTIQLRQMSRLAIYRMLTWSLSAVPHIIKLYQKLYELSSKRFPNKV